MKLTSIPTSSEKTLITTEPLQTPEDTPISTRRNALRKALGIGALCLPFLIPSKAQAEGNAISFEVFTSPMEQFKVNGIGLAFGHELAEDKSFHFGFELAGHCEIGLYSIDRATFKQTRPVYAGACLGTAGLSFGFDINKDWSFELIPHGGIGGMSVFPGKVGSDYYQNGATKGPFGVVGLEVLFKKEISSGWHYYFGGAYHGLIKAEEPSAPRGTPPNDYTHDLHLTPIGFEKEF